jgi:hypothetical protein
VSSHQVPQSPTHVFTMFANSYMACAECQHWAEGFHRHVECGCGKGFWLYPCGHEAEADSMCPHWSPVDGCQCWDYRGFVGHPTRG